MSSPVASLPLIGPGEDGVRMLQLAHELYGISIATKDECCKIARALLDVGCPTLNCLVELPISTVAELKAELGWPHNLSMLQLRRILKWIEQQRTAASSNLQHMPAVEHADAHGSDVGRNIPHAASAHARGTTLPLTPGVLDSKRPLLLLHKSKEVIGDNEVCLSLSD